MPKTITWKGSAYRDIKSFPAEARKKAGYELYTVQCGAEPSDWKPMPSVGAGVKEIRIHCREQYRIIYVAKFEESIYVLHGFMKKTQKTVQRDIEIARSRLKEVIHERRREYA